MNDQVVTFIHASDLHLDSPFVGLADRYGPRVRDAATQASISALNSLVRNAIDLQCDFVAIAGDLYDGVSVGVRARAAFLDAVHTLSEHEIRVCVALGNHDPLDEQWLRSSNLPSNLTIFDSSEPEVLTFPSRSGLVVNVVGVSYSIRNESRNLASMFLHKSALDGSAVTVGILHSNVGSVKEHAPYAPANLHDITRLEYDYFALGHIHSFEVLSQRPMVVYSGTTQGRSFKSSEQGAKGALVVSIRPEVTPVLRFVELGTFRFEKILVDLSSLELGEDPLDAMDYIYGVVSSEISTLLEGTSHPSRRFLLRVVLNGRVSSRIRIAEHLREYTDLLGDKIVSGGGGDFVILESIRDETASYFDLDEIDVVSISESGGFLSLLIEDFNTDGGHLGTGETTTTTEAILTSLSRLRERSKVSSEIIALVRATFSSSDALDGFNLAELDRRVIGEVLINLQARTESAR